MGFLDALKKLFGGGSSSEQQAPSNQDMQTPEPTPTEPTPEMNEEKPQGQM